MWKNIQPFPGTIAAVKNDILMFDIGSYELVESLEKKELLLILHSLKPWDFYKKLRLKGMRECLELYSLPIGVKLIIVIKTKI